MERVQKVDKRKERRKQRNMEKERRRRERNKEKKKIKKKKKKERRKRRRRGRTRKIPSRASAPLLALALEEIFLVCSARICGLKEKSCDPKMVLIIVSSVNICQSRQRGKNFSKKIFFKNRKKLCLVKKCFLTEQNFSSEILKKYLSFSKLSFSVV